MSLISLLYAIALLMMSCCCTAALRVILDRKALLKSFALTPLAVALAAKPAAALDPVLRSSELWRIWQQRSADAVLGGELADPTSTKTLSPTLALIPVVRLRAALGRIELLLKDPEHGWQEAAELLASKQFSTKEIKVSKCVASELLHASRVILVAQAFAYSSLLPYFTRFGLHSACSTSTATTSTSHSQAKGLTST
jgi:hypothetical protein